jgi:Zn-dependent peptidase ImmA (M78 family)
MKMRLSSKGRVAIGGLKLTTQEIESQVMTDLTKYRSLFQERYGKAAPAQLDVENLVKELWGVDVTYEDIPQNADEETLGYFAPEVKTIVIDPQVCNNPRRVSFTVAHEAGHLSLHSFLFASNATASTQRTTKHKIVTNPSIEWQATIYAAHLLAPKHEVVELLQGLGLAAGNIVPQAIDVEKVLVPFQERFGLSRQAMEVHFHKLGIPTLNNLYRAL